MELRPENGALSYTSLCFSSAKRKDYKGDTAIAQKPKRKNERKKCIKEFSMMAKSKQGNSPLFVLQQYLIKR